MKGLVRDDRQLARGRPSPGRIEARAFDQRMEPLSGSAKFARQREEGRPVRHKCEELVRQLLPPDGSLRRRVAAVLQEMVMQIDLHRAGLRARSAEGRGVGEVLPILKTAQVRSDDGAIGP